MFGDLNTHVTESFGREDYIQEAFTRLCAARIGNGSHDCTRMSDRTQADLFQLACDMADRLETTGVATWLAICNRRHNVGK